MADPLMKGLLVLTMKRFKTKDGEYGYSLSGTIALKDYPKTIKVDVRCGPDGQLKVVEGTGKKAGKKVVLANKTLWKKDDNNEGFGYSKGGSKGSW